MSSSLRTPAALDAACIVHSTHLVVPVRMETVQDDVLAVNGDAEGRDSWIVAASVDVAVYESGRRERGRQPAQKDGLGWWGTASGGQTRG